MRFCCFSGNNNELEKKHSITGRSVAKQRLDYNEAESSRLQFRDELETLKYTVDRTAADLESLRGDATLSVYQDILLIRLIL